jgi:hypothetical protein
MVIAWKAQFFEKHYSAKAGRTNGSGAKRYRDKFKRAKASGKNLASQLPPSKFWLERRQNNPGS